MLQTSRLVLRPMVLEDTQNLFNLNSDPEVVRFTGDAACKDLTEAQRIVTELSEPQFQKYKMGRFSTFLKDGTYIGWCGLKYFEDKNEVDLGYRFAKKFWGQGFATEASEACLDYGFQKLNLKRIIARAMPDNIASIKVIQKLKMNYRGLMDDTCEPHSYVLYDLTQAEYFACAAR